MQGEARFTDRVATGVLEVTDDPHRLASGGFWTVVLTFEGELTAARMAQVDPVPAPRHPPPAPAAAPSKPPAPPADADLAPGWTSSLDRAAYQAGVEHVRAEIARGEVYQVNLCRVLSHPLHPGADLDVLAAALQEGNPAPYASRIHLPQAGIDLVCASPELFLSRRGDRVTSGPIKGTAPTAAQMLPKDRTENVMITDLVRNDLSRVCRPGTVAVEGLCVPQEHPGLVHLVSHVAGRLRPGAGWAEVLDATTPPGSVSGAPKSSALRVIRDLEPVARGPYCGAVGWVDADRDEAELAVGIRTFWATGQDAGRLLHLGTGAGITWDSDAEGEWWETVLKARRLAGLAGLVLSSTTQG